MTALVATGPAAGGYDRKKTFGRKPMSMVLYWSMFFLVNDYFF